MSRSMTVEDTREWIESIDVNEADDETFTELEDKLTEIEVIVNSLDEALRSIERIETDYEHMPAKDERTIRSSEADLDRVYQKYMELYDMIEAKFQTVDDELYDDE